MIRIEGNSEFRQHHSRDQSEVNVTIYPNSVDTNNPKLEEELRGDKWFNIIKFPRATYRATRIERTGPITGKISGDFTFLGITRAAGVGCHFDRHRHASIYSKAGDRVSTLAAYFRSFGLRDE